VIRIRLFGELDLRMGDERLPALESARVRSLLTFLLLHDDAPVSRQRLAFLLWPDSSEGQARTNLRHLLHTLRQRSPDVERFLEVSPQMLRWRRELPYWLDVAAFEDALARADADGVSTADALAALREAIDLYTGDLLEGDYDEWLVGMRERLRDHYVGALPRAVRLLDAAGDHAEAIRMARQLIRSDPLREDSYQQLMRLLDATGDRAGAMRVYHQCATTLERELGVAPSAATVDAYAELTRAQEPTGSGSGANEPVVLRGGVLVGRDREWQQLTADWRDAEAGRSQLVLVTGEPGVGKTRLVEELATWCAHRGAVIARARSYATEGELGYGVVISWLRADDVAAHLRRVEPPDRAELARLVPELAGASALAPPPVDEAEQRRRLFEAVARTVVASGRPTLLVADDVQWCDAQSLQLIHYLVRLDPSAPLLVVGTVRREELDDDHPLTALASGLQLIDRATEIAVGRLDRVATEELARELAGVDLDAFSVDALHAETEGNPLFIVEALRAGWNGSGTGAPLLAPKVQAVIAARLGRLSGPARDLAGVAATVGREFSAALLAGVSGIDDVTLVRALDELWRRGIVREQGTDAYDFAHGRIRDVAYETLSPAERRRNHLLIAAVLVHLHRLEPDAVSGEVARHYDRGGQIDDAVRWYQRAAVQAQRLHADVEAVRLLDRAGVLVAGLPDGERIRFELEVLSALATPLAAVEGFASDRLVAAQGRALQLAAVAGTEPEPSLLRSMAMSSLCRHDFDGARTVARDLRDQAERSGDDVLLVESEYLLGIGAFWDADFVNARHHFERAVALFRPEQRIEHLLRFGQDPRIVCLSRLANTLWFLGERGAARRARDEAVAMAGDVGYPFSRGVAYVFAALLSVDLGEPVRYREYAAVLGRDAQHASLQVAAGAFLGYADVLDGRVADGIARIRNAVDTGSVDHAPGQGATHLRLLVAAYDHAGDTEGGLAAADEALRVGGTRIWEAEHRRQRATFLADLGASGADVDDELARAALVARDQGAIGLERRVARTRSRLRRE
jgi:DNA-binding SARP family transcriptional activator